MAQFWSLGVSDTTAVGEPAKVEVRPAAPGLPRNGTLAPRCYGAHRRTACS